MSILYLQIEGGSALEETEEDEDDEEMEVSEHSEDEHADHCFTCKDGGELLCCEQC